MAKPCPSRSASAMFFALSPALEPGKLIFAFGASSAAGQHPAEFGPRAESRHSRSHVMAQVCDICGKGPQFGNNISHAHNITRRRWNVNLHPVKAKVNGGAKRLRVCSSCLKAGKVAKA